MSLAGKVTLITSGSKNLGASIATLFAADGAHLALHYNSASSKKSAEDLASSRSEKHGNITVKTYPVKVTSRPSPM